MDNSQQLSRFAIDFVMTQGASVAGITTTDTLAGGPPSTDLGYVLPGAKSAVSSGRIIIRDYAARWVT